MQVTHNPTPVTNHWVCKKVKSETRMGGRPKEAPQKPENSNGHRTIDTKKNKGGARGQAEKEKEKKKKKKKKVEKSKK